MKFPDVYIDGKYIEGSMYQLMMEFEEGVIDEDDEIKLFQYLVDTGLAWKLQSFYGKYAELMLQEGLVYEYEQY